MIAVGPPGLEPVLAGELAVLGLRPPRPFLERGAGGRVAFEGGARELHRAHLGLRTAERVLVPVGTFPARDFASLEAGLRALPWRGFRVPGRPLSVRVRCHASKLYHEGAVAQRVRRVLGDGGGVEVLLEGDACAVLADATGEPALSRRGYRLETAKAPLRESLAAALVLASGWDRASTLIDPFCGSGTVAIEAAAIARGAWAGAGRRFAFMDWPRFAGQAWTEPPAPGPRARPRILASDRDAGAVAAARANAARAGLADAVELSCRAVSAVERPAGPGWVVTNPPYGARVEAGRGLYAALGRLAAGWGAAMLCPSPALARATGLPFDAGVPVLNGGMKVRLVRVSAV